MVEALRFGVVGCINTVIDFLVFFLLVWAVDLDIVPANICSFSIAVINSYFMNKHWSFHNRKRDQSSGRQLAVFVVVNLAGMGLSTLTVWWLAGIVPLVFAKVMATVVCFAWNFIGSRQIVYRAA